MFGRHLEKSEAAVRAEEVELAIVLVLRGGLIEIEPLAANQIFHPHIASLSSLRSATTFWNKPPK